jgi:serine/threonine-protein phosphatase 5
MHIFQVNGFPSKNNVYIFNGDIMDRGKSSVQVLTALLLFKLHCPQCVHITRGNHETGDFLGGQIKRDFLSVYDEGIYSMFVQVAHEIPVAIILDHKVLVIHGGINRSNLTLEEINTIPKGEESEESDLLAELLWADPQASEGTLVDMERGTMFGPDVSKAFLQRHKLKYMVRGHTTVENGLAKHHNGRVITIWSAPQEGKGCYANIDSNLELHVRFFEAYPKVATVEDWTAL